jgi:nitroreductase
MKGNAIMLKDLIRKNRSYRRFHEATAISEDTLRELVDLARLSASASNKQPLKYVLSCDPARNGMIFPCLAWAGYLPEWDGPEPGERPSAYIIILGDTEISDDFSIDPGIAAQSIMLGAAERGLGGCIIGSIKRVPLRRGLTISERFKILYVLALGEPAEEVVLDAVGQDGDIKYWRDENSVHHVPKRALDDIILG